MILTDYNEEETLRRFRREWREDDLEEGRQEERESLLQAAISRGMLTPEQANELRSIRSQ